MQKLKTMKKYSTNIIRKIILIIFALLALICIRIFQNELFYDPFISFFKVNFHNQVLPDFDTLKLIVNLFFRYALNSLCTIWILYLLFNSNSVIKLATLLLAVFFILLLILFLVLIHAEIELNYMLLFYVRRFLIQPIFLLLFIPAFYYQTLRKKN